MNMKQMFNKKEVKTYIKVTESTSNKGIETYFDAESIVNINPIYKEQLLSIFVSGINILSHGRLSVISNVPDQEEEKVETKTK